MWRTGTSMTPLWRKSGDVVRPPLDKLLANSWSSAKPAAFLASSCFLFLLLVFWTNEADSSSAAASAAAALLSLANLTFSASRRLFSIVATLSFWPCIRETCFVLRSDFSCSSSSCSCFLFSSFVIGSAGRFAFSSSACALCCLFHCSIFASCEMPSPISFSSSSNLRVSCELCNWTRMTCSSASRRSALALSAAFLAICKDASSFRTAASRFFTSFSDLLHRARLLERFRARTFFCLAITASSSVCSLIVLCSTISTCDLGSSLAGAPFSCSLFSDGVSVRCLLARAEPSPSLFRFCANSLSLFCARRSCSLCISFFFLCSSFSNASAASLPSAATASALPWSFDVLLWSLVLDRRDDWRDVFSFISLIACLVFRRLLLASAAASSSLSSELLDSRSLSVSVITRFGSVLTWDLPDE
mmetsp:Transcript_6294/g.25451  ORF Transcript_6294/g.25451 Transcript_6294/m.25451 type:complete len:418 (-) Transcript_6294:108-1361(-)